MARKNQACPKIEIRRVGLVEVGSKYRWRDGYSVIIDGRESQPWLPKRKAQVLARRIAVEQGCPKIKIKVV